jgi:hypothetical protein
VGRWGMGLGGFIKKAGKAIGKVASGASKVVGLIPGVGSAVAPVLAAGGSVLQGKNMKSHLGAAAQAALPIVGGKLGGLAGKAIGGVASKLPGKLGQAITPIARDLAPGLTPAAVSARGATPTAIQPVTGPTGPAQKPGLAGMARDVLMGGQAITPRNVLNAVTGKNKTAGGVTGAIGNVVDYAKEHPGQILAGAAGISGALDAKKAGQLRDAALGRTRETYAAKAPLRERAMSGLMNTARPDLSSVYRDTGNPYASSFGSARPAYGPVGPPPPSMDPGRVPMGGAGRVGGPGPAPGSPLSVAAAETGQRTPSSDPVVAQEMAKGPLTGGGLIRRSLIEPAPPTMALARRPKVGAKTGSRAKVA